jgi:hypothetical protein
MRFTARLSWTNSRNWLATAWTAVVVCCLGTLIWIGLHAPADHDEALTMIELAGQSASPWPTDAALVSTLKKEKLETTARLPQVVAGLEGHEAHPPLYFILLWTVTRFAKGARLVDYRLFSVVLGIATLYLLARWTRSLLCFTLLALSSEGVLFFTFARPYMLAILFILITAYLLDPELDVPDWVRCAAGLCGALAVWTQYLAVLPIGIILLWSLLLSRRRKMPVILGAALLCAALAAPALWLAYIKMHSMQTGRLGTTGVFPGWFAEIRQAIWLFRKAPTDPVYAGHPFYQLPAFLDKLASAIFLFSLLTILLTFRVRSRRVQLAFLLVVSQPVLLVLLSAATHELFLSHRYMGLLLPFYYVLIAEALSGAGFLRRPVMALYVGLVVTASLMTAAGTLRENSLRKTELAADTHQLAIIWAKTPGMPAAILNDLPDKMSLYFIQSDEGAQKAIGWTPATYRKAFFCPMWNTPHTGMYKTLRSHFSSTGPRILRNFDCYPWAGDNQE